MKVDMKEIGTTALKVTGVACATTGIVAAGAVIACGAAVGSMAEGFAMARRAAVSIWKREKTQEEKAEEMSEEMVEDNKGE